LPLSIAVTVAFPLCLVMISDSVASSNSDMKVFDVTKILAERHINP
jgi:hypothetical protein